MMNKYFHSKLKVNDTDICTSATPDEMKRIFKDNLNISVLNTGLKHGTVSIVLSTERIVKLQEKTGIKIKWAYSEDDEDFKSKEVYEITTYRLESDYSDSRHPDKVEFTRNIEDDLVRRDFTINAMAYCRGKLIGIDTSFYDMENGIIKCVGNPEERFNEDPLRILRAFRFQAKLGFSVDKYTLDAAHKLYKKLDEISKERIHTELIKAFSGKFIHKAVIDFKDILVYVLRPLDKTVGLVQINPHHVYDVYTHSAKALFFYCNLVPGGQTPDYKVALAIMLHDIGKPECLTYDNKGIAHFYGHVDVGSEIVHKMLKKLKFSNVEISEIETLVKNHELYSPNKAYCKRLLSKIGEDTFRKLITIRTCDIEAQSEYNRTVKHANIVQTQLWLDEIIESEQAISLKDIKVNGNDLIKLGIPVGKEIGLMLKEILQLVIDEKLDNNKEDIIEYIQKKGGKLSKNG